MRTILIAILTTCSFLLQAQTTETKPGSSHDKKAIANQRSLEDERAEQFFKENYSKKTFKRYEGGIVANGERFKYAEQVLVVWNTPNNLRAIFYKGIFYPSIIVKPNTTKSKSKEELKELTAEQRAMYYLTRTDSLTITNLEELPLLSKSPTQKRFRFWLYRKGLHNPQVCFFELTNERATNKTAVETFIDGAVLTFYKDGWIII